MFCLKSFIPSRLASFCRMARWNQVVFNLPSFNFVPRVRSRCMVFNTIIFIENFQFNIYFLELKLQPPVLRHNLMTVCAFISIIRKPRSDHAHTHNQFLLNYITKYRKQNQSLQEKHKQQLQQPTYWDLYLNKPSPFSIRFTRRRWVRRSMRDRQNHTQICF